MNASDPQVRCVRGCLDDVAAKAFTAHRSHAGTPYLLLSDDGGRKLWAAKRQDKAKIRAALDVAHRRLYPDHSQASDAALKRATEVLMELAAAAELDPEPAPTSPAARGGAGAAWADGLEVLPAGWVCPARYQIKRSGVYKLPVASADDDVDREPMQIAYGPVVPVRVFTDPDGRQMIDLAFHGTFGWTVKSVDRSIARSGRRLVATLGDDGLPVIESDGKHVERYLAEAESVNAAVIPAEVLARWVGWQPDGLWLMPSSTERRIEWRWSEQAQFAERIRQVGTLDGWQAAIRDLERDVWVQIVLATAFAAPLLRPLDLPVGVLDIYASSTRGKSSSVKIAYSVWGAPLDAGEHGIGSWGNGLPNLEKYASLAHGVLLVLDDSQKAPKPEGRKGDSVVKQLMYAVSEGKGKGRAGQTGRLGQDLPNDVLIRTFLVSTGEKPLTAFNRDAQGLAARRLPFGRNPFPLTDDPGAEGKRIEGIVARLILNHGHAGPAFVQRLQRELATDAGHAALKRRHAELTEDFRGETPMTARRAPMAAAVFLGAELAHAWGILPLPPPPLEVWLDVFTSSDATDGEDVGQAAVRVLESELAAHPDRLYSASQLPIKADTYSLDDRSPAAGFLARYDDVGGNKHLIANRELVRELLDRKGYDFDAVMTLWKDSGVLVAWMEGKTRRWSKRTTLGPGRTRIECLVFSRSAIDPDDDWD